METTQDLLQFEIVRHVTLPVFQIPQDGSPIFLRLDSKIEQAQEQEQVARRRKVQKDAAGNPVKDAQGNPVYEEPTKRVMDPPLLCEVTNLKTGEIGQIVVNSTIDSTLDAKYPNDTYVSKCFQFRYLATKKSAKGTNYKTFEIVEIKLKASATTPATNGAAKPAPASKR